jgi:hypothetical protein
MIDALISGRLYGAPQQRTTKAGKPFATAKLRVTGAEGTTQFVNAIAFTPLAVAGLLALQDGDSAALSGELTIKTWIDKEGVARPGLDLVAHAVLTAYRVCRKQQVTGEEASAEPSAGPY